MIAIAVLGSASKFLIKLTTNQLLLLFFSGCHAASRRYNFAL
jgi:hypothetical protein